MAVKLLLGVKKTSEILGISGDTGACSLKRDVLRVGLGGYFGALRICRRRAKKLNPICDDFGALTLAAVVFRFKLARSEPALNIHLAALVKYFLQLSAALPKTTMLCQSTRSWRLPSLP